MATVNRRRRRPRVDRETMAREALARAEANVSEANYPLIIAGFVERGIPLEDIKPRENVFTYHAWRAKGRQVMRGQHGVCIPTMVEFELTTSNPVEPTTEPAKAKARGTARVFHISQTCEIGAQPPEPLGPLGAQRSEPQLKVHAPSIGTNPLPARLREWADGLEAKIEHAERPSTQAYTPRRYKQESSRRCDGGNLREAQRAMRAMADAIESGQLPAVLIDVRTKSQIADLVRRRVNDVGGGYYAPYVLSDEYVDKSPAGVALQELTKATPRDEYGARLFAQAAKIRGLTIDGFFPTPPGLAQRMVELARIEKHHEVLEPNAGMGDLVLPILHNHAGAQVLAVEPVAELVEYLELLREKYPATLQVFQGRFEDVAGEVDRIVMNPPFERGQDAEHVMHAVNLLRAEPGRRGRLVALMSEGPFYRSDKKSIAFREWLDDQMVDVNEKIEGAFKGVQAFNQTGVNCRLLVIDK